MGGGEARLLEKNRIYAAVRPAPTREEPLNKTLYNDIHLHSTADQND